MNEDAVFSTHPPCDFIKNNPKLNQEFDNEATLSCMACGGNQQHWDIQRLGINVNDVGYNPLWSRNIGHLGRAS
jgi:hypothetical protein